MVVSGLLFGLGLWWQSVSPELAQHVQAGMEARDQHRLNDAIQEFRKVTELAPQLAAGFVNLGASCLESKDYNSAIPALKRALELNPQLVGAEQMLGYALLAQGSAAEAIPHLERANAQDALGIAQLKTGNFPDAVKNLEAALSKRPNDPDLLYYLGRASGLLSKNAFATLETAYPDAARAHQALGDSYAAPRQVPQVERNTGMRSDCGRIRRVFICRSASSTPLRPNGPKPKPNSLPKPSFSLKTLKPCIGWATLFCNKES